LALIFIVSLNPAARAGTITTSTTIGEDIVWSLSNASAVRFDHRTEITPSVEVFYYYANLHSGSPVTVEVDIANATQINSSFGGQRLIRSSIPDNGIRWVTEVKWLQSSGLIQPTSMSMAHRAEYNPYQADPPYLDSRHPVDKAIQIVDITVSLEPYSLLYTYIYILPEALVGIDTPEQNGLPKFARTEPDTIRKNPYGCNGCSEIGLPGYRVNMANLLPVIQDTLFQWAGRGPTVDLTLTWNAKQESGPTNFGTGWRFSYDSWLSEASDGVSIKQDDGGQLHFDIPTEDNANITSVTSNTATGDVTIAVDYVGTADEPSYAVDWDGSFAPDRSGYTLKKELDGDPSLQTFILTPPEEKLSYIYQGPSGTSDPLPLVAIEDWNGNRLQLTRNLSGAITTITDAVGRSATLTYNATGQCTTLTVANGNQVSFTYSGSNLVRVVDLIGNQTDYTYNGDQLITTMNTEGQPWQFAWTTTADMDHLSSVTDPQGNTTSYSFFTTDFAIRKTQVIDASGRSFTYNYPYGQYTKNSRQQTPTVVSDALGRPVQIQAKGSSQTTRTLAYTDTGALSQVTEYDGGIHRYAYNDLDLVTEYVDALGESWTSEYDAFGNLIRTQSPVGRAFQHSYDVYGQLTQSTDPEGNVATRTYDNFGNIKTVTDGEGSTTTFGYDVYGLELTSITDPLGRTTSFTYDANRRQTRVTNPDGTYRETVYNCCAAIGSRNENGDLRSVTRSPSMKVLSETDYLGNAMTYSYDGAGRQVKQRDPAGRSTTTTYNNLGQVTAVQNPDGDSVGWTYYSNTDELFEHTLSQALGVTVSATMTWRGVPYRANDYSYVRDRMGRLLRILTPDYHSIEFSRDSDGLLTEKKENGTTIATFSRDLNGFLSSSSHPLGTDTYQRNARNQVTRQTWYDGLAMDFSYDGAGQPATLIYPDGSTAVYQYDARGRITDISWKGSSIATQYDPASTISGEIRSNGVNTAVSSDKNSQPTRIQHVRTSQTLFDLQCSRNSRGLLSECTRSGDAVSWVPALTSENTSSQYTYNHSFTIVTRNGQAAATDAMGNQTAIPGPRAFTGVFDYQNLLTSWSTSMDSNEAVYDGQNRLIQWTQGTVVRRFHYDESDRLLFETDANNTLTAMWLYRGKQIVAMADNAGLYFYHNDLSSNVAFLTDTAAQIVASYRYLPFGLQTQSLSTIRNPFTFVGTFGVLDLGEGLYYMRSRTYDALTRAFLSNDPVGLGVTANAREYARNNPVNWIDPSGRVYMRSDIGGNLGRDSSPADWNYYQKPSGSTDNGCLVGTAWNIATSQNGNLGGAAGVLQMLDKLRQGGYELGEALLDGAGTALGMYSTGAGVFAMFMGANKTVTQEEENSLIEKAKADPNSYYNQHSKPSPPPYEFTLPPFSLDE